MRITNRYVNKNKENFSKTNINKRIKKCCKNFIIGRFESLKTKFPFSPKLICFYIILKLLKTFYFHVYIFLS